MSDPIVETNKAICEALGLDPHDIVNLTIQLSNKDLPIVDVGYSHFWVQKHMPGFSRVVRQYKLTPIRKTSTEREQA